MSFLPVVLVLLSINLHISEPTQHFTVPMVLTGKHFAVNDKLAEYLCRVPLKQIHKLPVAFTVNKWAICAVFQDCTVLGVVDGYECNCVNSTDNASYYRMAFFNTKLKNKFDVKCLYDDQESNNLKVVVYTNRNFFEEDMVLTGPTVTRQNEPVEYVCKIPVKQITDVPMAFFVSQMSTCTVFPDCSTRGVLNGYQCKCVNSTDKASYYLMKVKNPEMLYGPLVSCGFQDQISNIIEL